MDEVEQKQDQLRRRVDKLSRILSGLERGEMADPALSIELDAISEQVELAEVKEARKRLRSLKVRVDQLVDARGDSLSDDLFRLELRWEQLRQDTDASTSNRIIGLLDRAPSEAPERGRKIVKKIRRLLDELEQEQSPRDPDESVLHGDFRRLQDRFALLEANLDNLQRPQLEILPLIGLIVVFLGMLAPFVVHADGTQFSGFEIVLAQGDVKDDEVSPAGIFMMAGAPIAFSIAWVTGLVMVVMKLEPRIAAALHSGYVALLFAAALITAVGEGRNLFDMMAFGSYLTVVGGLLYWADWRTIRPRLED